MNIPVKPTSYIMHYKSLYIFWALLAASLQASENYFFNNEVNSPDGSEFQDTHQANPRSWQSLYSQYAGSQQEGKLKLPAKDSANWTFKWKRPSDDDSSYDVQLAFDVTKSFPGGVAIDAGFQDVYSHTQVPWPGGYWVSKDQNWFPVAEIKDSDAGNESINGTILVPAHVEALYVRIRPITDRASSGFVLINGGSVSFKKNEQDWETPGQARHSVSILDFGADPSGESDSSSAIQNALNGGGTIRFPAGHYKISRTLVINRSDTSLVGEEGATVFVAAGSPVTAISNNFHLGVWEQRNLSISGLTLINMKENYKVGDNLQHTKGIDLRGAQDVRIKDVAIYNFQHDGIIVEICKDVLIDSCRIDGPRHGITINGQREGGRYGNWNIKVVNCTTVNNWDTGIIVGFYSYDVVVSGNYVGNARCHAIDIFNTSNVIITNNVVKNWLSPDYGENPRVGRAVGIFVHTDWGLSTYKVTSDITVANNQLLYEDTDLSVVQPQGIEITGNVDGVIVTGNSVTGGYDGIFVREQPYDRFYKNRPDKREAVSNIPRNIVVSNNVCQGQTGRPFWVESSEVFPMTVSSNVFASKSGKIEMRVDADREANLFLFNGNIVRCDFDSTFKRIVDNSKTNVIAD